MATGSRWGATWDQLPGHKKITQALLNKIREDLLDSRVGPIVFLLNLLCRPSRGEFVFVLISLVGILSLLLVVTASVAYLALPRGRLCPQCGGATNPVVLQRLLRILSLWVQWRWCARCGWEGPGLRGPDLGQLDPPADRDTGFRRGNGPDRSEEPDVPDIESVPTFHWRSSPQKERRQAPPDHPSGFKFQSEEESTDPAGMGEGEEQGFHFRPPGKRKRPEFRWGPRVNRGDIVGTDPKIRAIRPWYLSWLVSKEAPGFQWRERRE
jgi:hypothetical protein